MIDFCKTYLKKSATQNHLNYWVVCDYCGKGRWCQKNNAIILPEGQPCKSCSNSLAAEDRRKHKDGVKQCCKCGKVLPLSDFTKRIDRPDSYRGKCNYCMAEMASSRRENNPELVREQHRQAQRTRRARSNQSEGSFTREDWQEVLEKYNHRCLSCGSEIDLQPDHVIPLSAGGKNAKGNIQPLCGKCNRYKQAKTIDYRVYA